MTIDLPLFRPDLTDDEIGAAVRVLRSSVLTGGEEVRLFENEFAQYQNATHGVALNSCTSALYLTLKALGVGPGDEVITSPITWVATALAIRWTGAVPVFADVTDRGLLDPSACVTRITPRTRAIIPVHLHGEVCDVAAFQSVAQTFSLRLVWDCAHAIESRFYTMPCGSFPDAACYSFFASKNVTAAGEGGMVVTDNELIANFVRRARSFGLQPGTRDNIQFGAKLNMTEVQAAVGRVQLRRVEKQYQRRARLRDAYMNAQVPGYVSPPPATGSRNALHLFAIRVQDRAALAAHLARAGIQTSIHYKPIYAHPGFANTKPPVAHNADLFGDETLSLPFFPSMDTAQAVRVADAVREVIA